jgi:hypothetical protein
MIVVFLCHLIDYVKYEEGGWESEGVEATSAARVISVKYKSRLNTGVFDLPPSPFMASDSFICAAFFHAQKR